MSKPRQYKPYVRELKPGRYAWCACGLSSKDPFCDGSHGQVGMRPKIVEITEIKTVAFCGCKATSTPPFCDGTHSKFSD